VTLFDVTSDSSKPRCCSHADAWHDVDGFCSYPKCHSRPPTMAEAKIAGAVGQAMSEASADTRWLVAAEGYVNALPIGHRFIAEDVVIALRADGITTTNAKAIGPVIARLARDGLIVKTGHARGARTSHGSMKPEWQRT
jgi:hypothetical protein